MGKRPDDIITVDWGSFTGDAVTIPVCMSSPVARGRSLRGQMEAIKPHIKDLTILICDSLDRHNRQDPEGIDRTACIMEGIQWKIQHLLIIQEYYPDVKFITWENDILTSPSFSRNLDAIRRLCDQSGAVQELRTSMSMFFLENKRRRFARDLQRGKVSGCFDFGSALHSSTAYLEEELAGDMAYQELSEGKPYVYWGLYVDQIDLFTKESGQLMAFPQTLPVCSTRHGPSVRVSGLPHDRYRREVKALFSAPKMRRSA